MTLSAAMEATGLSPEIWDRNVGGFRLRGSASLARARVWRLMRDDGMSLPKIGRECGCPHTTVMYALRRGEPVKAAEPEPVVFKQCRLPSSVYREGLA